MKKLRLLILILALISSLAFAAWKQGWILRGIESVVVSQAGRILDARISLKSLDMYGNFAVLSGLDIRHRDYRISIKEIIIEYSVKDMIAARTRPLRGIKRISLNSPSFWFREMKWEEIKPQVFPSWTGFVKAAPDLQGMQVSLVNGKVDLGANAVKDLNLELNFQRAPGSVIPLKIFLKCVFAAGKTSIPLKLETDVRMDSGQVGINGKLNLGYAVPYSGTAVFKGKVCDPKDPRVAFDIAFGSRSLKFGGADIGPSSATIKIEGDAGSPRAKGSFSAAGAVFQGASLQAVRLDFDDDTGRFLVSGSADLPQGRFVLNKSVYRKDKTPSFEGSLDFTSSGYGFSAGIGYKKEILNFSDVVFRSGGETVLGGSGAGRLTRERFSCDFSFPEGKYPGISITADLPFARGQEKRISVSYADQVKADAAFNFEKLVVPLNVRVVLSGFRSGGMAMSGSFGFRGEMRTAQGFSVNGTAEINTFCAYRSGGRATNPGFSLSDSLIGIEFGNNNLRIIPRLLNGRDAAGEVKAGRNKCEFNVTCFSEPVIRLTGEVDFSRDTVGLPLLRLNNTQISGNLDLRSKNIDLSVDLNEEDPMLFTRLGALFSPGLSGFKPEENSSISGNITVAGTFEHPVVAGSVEYKGKLVDSVRISSIRFEGETLSFGVEAKKGDSFLAVDRGIVLVSKNTVDINLSGGIRAQSGKGDDPAFLLTAPFYLNGRITGIESSPRFSCEAGIRDAVINKKLGRAVSVNMQYSDGKLEFLPNGPKNDYCLSGSVLFSDTGIMIQEFSLLQGEQKPLWINGSVAPADMEMCVDIRCREDMGNIALFFPGDISSASGKIDLSLNVSGSFGDPVLFGYAKLVNGEVAFSGVKDPVKAINAVLNFETGVIRLDSSTFFGGTTVFAGGDITYSRLAPTRLDIHVKNDYKFPLRISLPNFASGEIAFLIDITGDAGSPVGKGKVNIMNMSFSDLPAPKSGGGGGGLEFLSFMKWDVEMVFKNNNRYYNDFVEAEIARDAGFVFKWDGSSIYVKGKGEADRGRFNYMNAEFQIAKGSSYEATTVTEDGIPVIKGYLDAKGTAKVGMTKLTLVFRGEMGKIEPVLTSEPPASRTEMLAMLNPDFFQKEGPVTEEQFNDFLKKEALSMVTGSVESQYITKPISSAVRRALRVDVFRIKSDMLKNIAMAVSAESTPVTLLTPFEGSSVEVGKYITDSLYVNYKAILEKGGALTSEWGAEYLITGDETRSLNTRFTYKPSDDPLKTEYELFIEASIHL